VPSLQSHELEQLRELVASRLGLSYSDDKLDFLANVAEKRREANGCASFKQYLEFLAAPGRGVPELRALAEELTVTETFFFRNADHFRALTASVRDAARTRGQRRLRILSAGCASGEEPYSLAMSLREAIPELSRWDVRILAIDINRAMLAKAARGSYSSWSLRATSEALRARYFTEKGREFLLDPSIREMVVFEERNLSSEEPGFWGALACDVIFCRNVVMYFTPEVMRRVVGNFARALQPAGLLFLGHAETLRGLSDEYHLCHTHDTFYYRRRGPDEVRPESQSVELTLPELPAVVDSAASPSRTPRNASRHSLEHTPRCCARRRPLRTTGRASSRLGVATQSSSACSI
jgi:chemotaxis protein methyltransferase CheR